MQTDANFIAPEVPVVNNSLNRDSLAGAALAIHGGRPTVSSTPTQRERWGEPELRQLEAALQQDTLFYWNGPQTKLLVEGFQKFYPLDYVMPCSSGTAALHIAIAACGVGPGDEVITSPITDIGTVTGVLYQGGVPVFADLDARTYNLDVADVESKITAKTRAVIAVHLAGNPCDLGELRQLCDEHSLVLIEDCAQAWGAKHRGAPVGTIGHIGCWSLNDFKHIGCGDGGIVASSDERFGPLLQKYGDKAYNRVEGAKMPDVLAPNYRISELQSAVAATQMTRMWDFTGRRGAAGRALNEQLQDVPGILSPRVHAEDRWTCWFYLLRIDPAAFSCDRVRFVEALQAEGLACGAGYIAAPVYRYPLFQNENFLHGRWPVKELGLTAMDYKNVSCPGAELILQTCVFIPVNEAVAGGWPEEAGTAIRKVAAFYSKR